MQYMLQSSSIRFGTLKKPAHLISKVDYTINHIYEFMTTSEINTLTKLCETKGTQFLSILSLAQTNPFTAGDLLTRNRGSFIDNRLFCFSWMNANVKFHLHLLTRKVFWQVFSLLSTTIYCVDPLSRQTHSLATENACDSNPADIIALEPVENK